MIRPTLFAATMFVVGLLMAFGNTPAALAEHMATPTL
ncbi:MAG: hypothetical protein GFH27_549333n91 [Chloroflexi bacterium AL-W]|nr:hypothetical protein [Chloroflexi bacterium AL-N1]NOK70456.1 hypothetical protein [Chloroflexi bacterium AL-N10]NOK78185.1 hypothetical protein [Chloroflexi bacterium AL-N5]NOK85284.1 hypothetical protein [Chloroflexi bacterium AL-W]NOK92049.1 hypothetical protein [Chloroflexi bacterium AL-N15]